MPNRCDNRAIISNEDSDKIEKLASAIREGKFCNHVIPLPEGLEDWYGFCTSRWGTKWDITANQEALEVVDNTLEFSFDSAWSPPIGVYEELVKQGYDVVAYYYEPGMGYVGEYNNGQDSCYEYGNCTSNTVVDTIGKELDDMFGISEMLAECEEL